MVLNEAEVVAVKWVQFHHFLSGNVSKFAFETKKLRPKLPVLVHNLLSAVRLDRIYLPCFRLPGPVITNDNSSDDISSDDAEWKLWGLSFSVLRSVLSTPAHDTSFPHVDVDTQFQDDKFFAQVDNKLVNFLLNFYHRNTQLTPSEAGSMSKNTFRIVKYTLISVLCVHSTVIMSAIWVYNTFC